MYALIKMNKTFLFIIVCIYYTIVFFAFGYKNINNNKMGRKDRKWTSILNPTESETFRRSNYYVGLTL